MIADLANSSKPQFQSIAKSMNRDVIKKEIIPNLITIWEGDLKKAVKENKINEFLNTLFKFENNTILHQDLALEDLLKNY